MLAHARNGALCHYFFSSDTSNKDVATKEVIVGIVTDIDLLHHVSKQEQQYNAASVTPRTNSEGESSEDGNK